MNASTSSVPVSSEAASSPHQEKRAKLKLELNSMHLVQLWEYCLVTGCHNTTSHWSQNVKDQTPPKTTSALCRNSLDSFHLPRKMLWTQ